MPLQHPDTAAQLIDAWKAISVALTGAFGVLGLLTKYRNDDTGKITWAGKVNLVGILLSTSLGVVAQLVETDSRAKENTETINKTKTIVENTSKSVENTSVAVSRINRLMTPAVDLTLEIEYKINCSAPSKPDVCNLLKQGNSVYFGSWPSRTASFGVLNVAISHRQPRIDAFRVLNADLSYYALPDKTSVNLRRLGNPSGGILDVRIDAPLSINDGGTLTSFLDFSNETIYLSSKDDPFIGQMPHYIMLQNRTGQHVIIWDSKLHRENHDGIGLFLVHLFNEDLAKEVMG